MANLPSMLHLLFTMVKPTILSTGLGNVVSIAITLPNEEKGREKITTMLNNLSKYKDELTSMIPLDEVNDYMLIDIKPIDIIIHCTE